MTTKAEFLRTVERGTAPGDWCICLTPADDVSDTSGACTYLDDAVPVRVWLWANSPEAALVAATTLDEFRLSGLPQSIAEKATVRVLIDIDGEPRTAEFKMDEFLALVLQERVSTHDDALANYGETILCSPHSAHALSAVAACMRIGRS